MKYCRFVVLAFLLCFAAAATAQVGIYGEFSSAKLDEGWIHGPTFGAYFESHLVPVVSLGLDARGSFLGSGDNGSPKLNSGLAGPRVGLKLHIIPIQPYVEALIGAGHIEAGAGPARTSETKFEYQFLGGLDLTILPRIDWRVVEFSYGGLSSLGGSFNPKTISTGLVLRLP